MQRQAWVFLTDDDERALLDRLCATTGVKVLPGRYFRGDPALVRTDPASLETAQLRRNEAWLHLVHPAASESIVIQPVESGPYAGWSKLDEVRSEVVTLVRALPEAQGLGPSRLTASTHAWFAGEKLRKSAAFTVWVAEAMRAVEDTYPVTQFDWIRVAPGARAFAAGGGRLHYLYRDVALDPAPGAEQVSSHGSARK